MLRVFKTFGICNICMRQGQQGQAFRHQRAPVGANDTVRQAIADAFIAAHAKLCQVTDELKRRWRKGPRTILSRAA